MRNDEPECPFCSAAVSEEARHAQSATVAPGASRAKRYAARAALIASTAATVGCGGADKKKDTTTKKADPEPDDKPPPPTPYGCVWPDDDGTPV
jgi:hypothetical protein